MNKLEFGEVKLLLVNFDQEKEITIPCMNNGTGMMTAKMFVDDDRKIVFCSIHRGGSIGVHCHKTSDDISYVVSGSGKAICDDVEETLTEGCCHICKKGSEHSIFNTGDDDLVLLTVVAEK